MKRCFAALAALALAALACGEARTATVVPDQPSATPTPRSESAFDTDCTAYGFFPSPPDVTLESVLQHYEDMSRYGDFVLFQPAVPWEDFKEGAEGESQSRIDLRNQVFLAQRNGLDWVFVIDPLNGLNRREFAGLPAFWGANFGDPKVRAAYTNFTLWVLREFQPRYLGLASEINTYLDAYPDDVENYMSLYREVYDLIKAEAPETQVFVTFQWDDLNNMFAPAAEGRPAYETNWDQVEAFEPRLDIWAISSYPYFVFPEEPIPEDYYTPLLARTEKPIAVAEGGWASRPVGDVRGDPERQVAFLEAIDAQLGDRLTFWVYLLLNDFNFDAYREVMRTQGMSEKDIDSLGLFGAVGLREFDGRPKPALEVWERMRAACWQGRE